MSIGSVSTVPYVAPLPLTRTDQPSADVAAAAAAASPILTSPPLLASAMAAVLISQQGAGSSSSSSGVDLSGQDLRQDDSSKIDLTNANLKGANLAGKDLGGLNLSDADLTGADVSGAALTKTDLSGVNADGVNRPVATLVSTTLDNASLKGANLSGAYISDLSPDKPMDVGVYSYGATIVDPPSADVSGATLRGVANAQSNFENAKFNGSFINSALFQTSVLNGASLQRVGGHDAIVYSGAKNVDPSHIEGTAVVALSVSEIDGTPFEDSAISQLFIIVGWLPSDKQRAFRSLLLAARVEDKLVFAGKVGTGFDTAEMARLLEVMRPLEQSEAPVVAPRAAVRGARWIAPRLIAEIAYSEITGYGVLCHASYIAQREDMTATRLCSRR